jgi:putative MFS transporter
MTTLNKTPITAGQVLGELLGKLDNSSLKINHYKIITAGILGCMLEFFDYFLIGFVLAFIVVPWQLTFAQATIVLLIAGVGAILGAFGFGYAAERIGRRPIFLITVFTFSIPSGLMYLTPEGSWIYLSVMRFFVGLGVGGLYTIDLALVQEFVPSRYRGVISGLLTAFIPIGVMIASALAAYLTPVIGWRGLFLIALLPAFLTLLVRFWVPESPRWLISKGLYADAMKSINWVTGGKDDIPIEILQAGVAAAEPERHVSYKELFKYPRSLIVACLTNFCLQTGDYGMTLWGATLFVLVIQVTPAEAAKLFFVVAMAGFAGRWFWAFMSEAVGRRWAGMLLGGGATILLLIAANFYGSFLGSTSVFWLAFVGGYFFVNGGMAVIGPYASEVWPKHLRALGMGAGYGCGGIGKMLGPVALGLFAGGGNLVTPKATLEAVGPAIGIWAAASLTVAVCCYFGLETRNKSIEEIDELVRPSGRVAAVKEATARA